MAAQPQNTRAMFESWLNCPLQAQDKWFEEHQSALDLAFLWQMKQYAAENLLTAPTTANVVTQDMFRVAGRMRHEPLAFSLAYWSQGNCLAYSDPQQAIDCYRLALNGYRPQQRGNEALSLLANLLYVTSEVDLQAARHVYEEMKALQSELGEIDDQLRLRIEQNAGILLHRLGDYQAALAANERALAIARDQDAETRLAEIMGNQALVFGSMGRFAECERSLLESHKIAQRTNNALTAARMEMNLGELYTIVGQPREALLRFSNARTQFARSDNLMEMGSVALREARLLAQLGSFAQARRSYALANSHFRTLQMWPQVWQATYEGAIANRHYGTFPAALTLLDDAKQLWQFQQQHVWQAEWSLECAALALAQNERTKAQQTLAAWATTIPDQLKTPVLQAKYELLWAELHEQLGQHGESFALETAHHFYQRVFEYADQNGELQVRRQALAGLGRLTRKHAPGQANRLLLEAAAQDDLLRQELSVGELKASFLNQSSDLLERLLTWAIEDGQPGQALLLAWRAKGSALLELLQTNRKPVDKHAIRDEMLAVRNKLAAQHWFAAVEANRRTLPQATVEAELPDIARLEQQLIELRRIYYSQTMHSPNQNIPNSLSCLAQLPADMLIEYARTNDQIIAIVTDRAGNCRTCPLTTDDILLDWLDEVTLAFQSFLTLPSAQQSRPKLFDECRTLLGQGYDQLMRPLHIPQNVEKLLIAPCTHLHRVPFAALWNGVNYLVEQTTIEYIPTGALLGLPKTNACLGNPLVIAATANGMLPANLDQAEAILQIYPEATGLIDDANTLEHLHNLTIAPSFVHMTAHTIVRENNPLFTALQLSHETLSVEACYDLPIFGTELVTLSSCTTNRGMESDGALLAFQSAFFAAGAQRVLSTLWEIQGNVTCQWFARFYTKLHDGMAPPIALRQTQLEFLHTTWSHPVYWAAFACSRR